MVDPASGPFLFDTSAEGWLARQQSGVAAEWFRRYLAFHPVHVSAATVLERARGYSLLWRRATQERRHFVEAARLAYLAALGQVWPVD
ncbi:MAG: hypothetical protein HZB13_04200, partial [Acidobacteria bacterium]|nr:hypothetical protein [Acidobacteriota bacterium]